MRAWTRKKEKRGVRREGLIWYLYEYYYITDQVKQDEIENQEYPNGRNSDCESAHLRHFRIWTQRDRNTCIAHVGV